MVKVSVIVPVYKVEKYIQRCVDSILSQTLKQIELILVDDGSPDNCPLICDQYAGKDSRVKVIHQNNMGVSSARNAGLSIAVGEYVGFVDADDYVDICMFEKLYECAVKQNCLISCCNLNYIDENGNIERFDSDGFDIIKSEQLFAIMFNTNLHLRMGVWNKIYNHKLLSDVIFDNSQHMSEDLLFLLKVIFKTDKIGYLKEGLYYYLRHRQGAATSMPYGIFEIERLRNTQYMTEYIKSSYPAIYPQAVSYKCINGDLTVINKMIESKVKDREMIALVKKDLKGSMNKLLGSGISKRKFLQILICSQSFFLYKAIYQGIR